jgi:hypothetical protein
MRPRRFWQVNPINQRAPYILPLGAREHAVVVVSAFHAAARLHIVWGSVAAHVGTVSLMLLCA